MSETVTLHCDFGDHDWERPKQKGARPKNCPQHTAEIAAAKEAAREQAATETRFDRAKSLIESQRHMYEVAADDELPQLTYIDRIITTGLGAGYTNHFINPREEADLDLLTDRRNAIMKGVERRYKGRKELSNE